MRRFALAVMALAVIATSAAVTAKEREKKDRQVLDHTMKTLEGKTVELDKKYKGKVVLVVNVASKCGLTPQYEGLQALYKKHKKDGLEIAAFPCNQFGGQEPGSAEEIRQFCTDNYNVTFDVYQKVDVNGSDACKLYKQLTATDVKPAGKGKIGWNFEKFVIDRDGKVIARFSPRTSPDSAELLKVLKGALAEK